MYLLIPVLSCLWDSTSFNVFGIADLELFDALAFQWTHCIYGKVICLPEWLFYRVRQYSSDKCHYISRIWFSCIAGAARRIRKEALFFLGLYSMYMALRITVFVGTVVDFCYCRHHLPLTRSWTYSYIAWLVNFWSSKYLCNWLHLHSEYLDFLLVVFGLLDWP